jgi:hypothetical protein
MLVHLIVLLLNPLGLQPKSQTYIIPIVMARNEIAQTRRQLNLRPEVNDADLKGIKLENIIVGHCRTRPTQRFTPPPNDGPFIDDVDPVPICQAGNGSWASNFNPPPDLEVEQEHPDGGHCDGNGSWAPHFNPPPPHLEGEQEDYGGGHQDGNVDVNEDDPAESVDDDKEVIRE